MTRDNHTRRRDVRKYMADHGVAYTQALRALNTALTTSSPDTPPVFPPLTGVPRITFAHDGSDDGSWGLIARTDDGWVITPTSCAKACAAGRKQLVHVDYRDARTWEPAVTELPPVVRRVDADGFLPGFRRYRSNGAWVWAATGWAVDEPGEIADRIPNLAPSPDLPYEVRLFSLPSEPGWLFPRDYSGSQPDWYTLAWCSTLDDAAEIARRAMAYTSINRHGRARIWGPSSTAPSGREVVLTVDPPLTPGPPLPHVPFGALPAIGRPASPAPEPEPTWVDPAVVALARRPEHNLRVWNPGGGWRTVAWSSCRQFAAIVANLLCVGADGHPWPYGEIWGPGWRPNDEPRVLNDYEPDTTHQERVARQG